VLMTPMLMTKHVLIPMQQQQQLLLVMVMMFES
jgi:hypothetical protein